VISFIDIDRLAIMLKKKFALITSLFLAITFLPTVSAQADFMGSAVPDESCGSVGDTAVYKGWTFIAKLSCEIAADGEALGPFWEIASVSKIKPPSSNYLKPDGYSDQQYNVVIWAPCYPPYSNGYFQGEDMSNAVNLMCMQALDDLTFRWRVPDDVIDIQPDPYNLSSELPTSFVVPKTTGKVKPPVAVLAGAAQQAIPNTPVTYMTCVLASACTPQNPPKIKCPLGSYVTQTTSQVTYKQKTYITLFNMCGLTKPAANSTQGLSGTSQSIIGGTQNSSPQP